MTANKQQFSLRWNDYIHHVTDAFEALRNQNDLVDVTLCCEGKKIKAHKMLLSACSVYFRDIFKENPCQHPVIIFRNVRFDDLNAIIDFMYHGEVNISQDQLASFLTTAELLEVQGLTDNSEEEDNTVQVNPPEPTTTAQSAHKKRRISETDHTTSVIQELKQHDYIASTSNSVPSTSTSNSVPSTSTSNSTIAEQKVTVTAVKFETTETDQEDSVLLATIDGDSIANIENQNVYSEEIVYKNSSNDAGVLGKFRCQLCPKGFKHPTSLTLHKDLHTGKTKCPICRRSFSRSYDMRSHLQKIHQDQQMAIAEARNKESNNDVLTK